MPVNAGLRILVESSGLAKANKELEGLEKQGGKTERATDKFNRAFKRAGDEVGRTARTVKTATLALTALAAAGGVFVRMAGKQAKEMKILADLASTGVEDFQAYAYATETAGISAERLADISKDVVDRLGDFVATGGGEFRHFFEQVAPKVGLTAEALQGLAGPEVLVAVKKAMDDANVSSEEQVFYLEAIADNASKLSPLLKDNAAALREKAAEAQRVGRVLSEVESQSLLDVAAAAHSAGGAISGLGNRVVVEFAPLVTSALDSVVAGISNVSAGLASGQIQAYLDAIGRKFDGLANDVGAAVDFIVGYFGAGMTDVGGRGEHTVDQIVSAFRNLPENVRAFVQTLAVGVASEFDKIVAESGAFVDRIAAVFTDDTIADVDARLAAEIRAIEQARNRTIVRFEADRQSAIQSFESDLAAADKLRAEFDSRAKGVEITAPTLVAATAPVDKAAAKASQRLEAVRARDFDQLVTSLRTEEEAVEASYLRRLDIIRRNTAEGSSQRADLMARLDKERTESLERIQDERDRDLIHLTDSLRTEEERVLESYQRRAEIIRNNTAEGSAERGDLTARLDKEFAGAVVGGFGEEPQGFDDKIATIEEEFAARREVILANTQLTEEARTELEVELTRRRNEQVMAIETERTQMMMQNGAAMFASLTSAAKGYAGEQSGIYRALFAASKGFAIADAIVKIQQGIASAATTPWPANLAAMASVISATAGIVPKISGTEMQRMDMGGSIGAGQSAIVGEIGPEIVRGPAEVISRRETARLARQALTQNDNRQSVENRNFNIEMTVQTPDVASFGASKDQQAEDLAEMLQMAESFK